VRCRDKPSGLSVEPIGAVELLLPIAVVNAQKCPGARKDIIFEARRTVLYVESQILCPDAADGRFSALTTYGH